MSLPDFALLPENPGVYIMKNSRRKIIYVGKAKNLKARISSYFTKEEKGAKTHALIQNVDDIETIITPTEKEALILECNLIKKHRPKYNVLYKDDKSYPFIKVDMSVLFPRLEVVRNPSFRQKKPSVIFFGPFPTDIKLKNLLQFLNKLFKIRTCKDSKMRNRTRPCINYDMGLCPAPCTGLIDSRAYKGQINAVLSFLKGQDVNLLKHLQDEMREESEKMNFERAAFLRDRLRELEKLTEKQIVTEISNLDLDALGYFHNNERILVYLLHVRQGLLLGGSSFLLNIALPEYFDISHILQSFINQHYNTKYIPRKLALPIEVEDQPLIQEVLRDLSDKPVELLVPERGKIKELVSLAMTNAETAFGQRVNKIESISKILIDIKKKLDLPTLPVLIECFDISNFGGANPVASKVVCREGEMDKKSYRYYKIKGDFEKTQDDFGMLSEVIARSYRGNEEAPDLVLVDGGKGQLNSIQLVLESIGKNYPCAAIAKGRTESNFESEEVKKTHDRIFVPGRKNPINIKGDSGTLRLLSEIRDEAHRFAIQYNELLNRKELLS